MTDTAPQAPEPAGSPADTRSPAGSPQGRGTGWLIRAALLILLLQLLVFVRYRPSRATGADAPADEFSSARAMEMLRRIQGPALPHPIGSEEHDRVRDRVMAELRAIGLEPDIHETFVCNPRGACARVQNIVARVRGTGNGDAILLTAHYDSVPSGPGAGDDHHGVVTLIETARARQAGPPAVNDVILLISDGEERGLLGAHAFAAEHPWLADVRVVIDVEARGSRGPSLMFETGPNNGSLVALMAEHMDRPFTSSLYSSIYDLMPNRSDFTVFKRLEYPGLNFGIIGAVPHYHSRIDDAQHLDPNSVQHQGDNVWAVVRALADLPLQFPAGNAVYFDLLGFGIVQWRPGLMLPLSLLALLPPLLMVRLLRGRNDILTISVFAASGVLLLMLVAGVGAGEVLRRGVANARDMTAPWTAYPFPMWLALFGVGLGVPGLTAARLGRRPGAWAMLIALTLWLAAFSVVLSLVLVGGAYLTLIPALVLGGAGLVAVAMQRSAVGAAVAGVLVVSVFWLTFARGLLETMGLQMSFLQTLPFGVIAATLAPVIILATARERVLTCAAAGVAVVVGCVAALVVPSHTPDWPAGLNIQFHQDAGAGTARWLVRTSGVPLPDDLKTAGSFGSERIRPFPFSRPKVSILPPDLAYIATTDGLDQPGPEIEILSDAGTPDGGRRIRLRLRSPRGAPTAGILLAPETDLLWSAMNGRKVEPQSAGGRRWRAGWHRLNCYTTPPEGVEIELALGSAAPVDVIVHDEVLHLPPGGGELLSARPDWATPLHGGDVWTMTRRMQL